LETDKEPQVIPTAANNHRDENDNETKHEPDLGSEEEKSINQ
jgi:hypothetical protein